jgi:hypothetical protein
MREREREREWWLCFSLFKKKKQEKLMLGVGLCFGLSSSSQWISPLFIGVMEEGYEVLIWHES